MNIKVVSVSLLRKERCFDLVQWQLGAGITRIGDMQAPETKQDAETSSIGLDFNLIHAICFMSLLFNKQVRRCKGPN